MKDLRVEDWPPGGVSDDSRPKFLRHCYLDNLIAQQSLVVRNAEKYRHNPQFVDDAIDTIANSVARMRRLMEKLSSGSTRSEQRFICMNDAIRDAIRSIEPHLPVPQFKPVDTGLVVEADKERLTTVFEHLIRKAQDATGDDGKIKVDTYVSGAVASVRISDTGCGMTPDFVRERLFRPFDSTKGSQSMGIGAYQAREYVREPGGQLVVSSALGHGAVFSLSLPLAGDQAG